MNKKIISVFVGTVLALALPSSILPAMAATKPVAKATSAKDVGG
jgi:hypothetical protein